MVPSRSWATAGRKPERRFVEHDQIRRAHQAAPDGEHLLLAAGERAGRLPLAFGEHRKERKHALAIVFAASARARQQSAHFEIFGDRKRRENLPAFRHLADAEIADAMARPAGDIGRAEQDAPARRPQHAGDGADERSLAGAVGADDGDDRALFDVERYAIERLRVAVEHIEVFHAQHHTASAPRYDCTTAGSRTTASGVPSAIAVP